jgi:hypothetical protein
VVQAMQNRQGDNVRVKLIEGGRRCTWNPNGLRDALVGSGMIVVPDIVRDPLKQLPFAEDKEEVQTLAAQTAQETFAKRIRTRGGDGRAKDFNPRTDRDPVESRAIFAVIVADEKAGAFPKRRRLPKLLRHPDFARMARDRNMHDPPRGQLDDDKNENVPEPEIMRLQDITRPDSRRVIMQEGPPRLACNGRKRHPSCFLA